MLGAQKLVLCLANHMSSSLDAISNLFFKKKKKLPTLSFFIKNREFGNLNGLYKNIHLCF